MISDYENDSSGENRARVQKLQEDLRKAQDDLTETEWEHNIDEQKKLLNELFNDYSDLLNGRLDDLEALVSDMTESVNANSGAIVDEMNISAGQVGYTITDGMQRIMNEGVFAHYDKVFDGVTSVNRYLNSIEQMIAEMVHAADASTKPSTVNTGNNDLFITKEKISNILAGLLS